jgi:hypothetical protein
VDHEPETAAGADQVWLMRDGLLVAKGPPAEILVNVPMLKSCGIKVPPMLELFHSMGWPDKPITVEGAIALIQRHHLAQRRELKLTTGPLDSAPIHLCHPPHQPAGDGP